MEMFDKCREHEEHRRKVLVDRQVRLTINYSMIQYLGQNFFTGTKFYHHCPAQLVIEAPWPLVKPFVFDPDKLREMVPGFDCSILEFVQ